MTIKSFLGIDAGTQGLSVVLTDEKCNVIATGDGGYEMVSGLPDGCYEQTPADWVAALGDAMKDLRGKLAEAGKEDFEVLAIGISGQMHGEVLVDQDGDAIGAARLWCDSRNEDEGNELTELLGVKMPKRITAARWLWTTRHQNEKAKKVARLTTPAGWLSYCLTDDWVLGVGDASGMFPVNQDSLDYDLELMTRFDSLVPEDLPRLKELLPEVRRAGESGGSLNQRGAELLGLPVGVPVAPAEGDQPAALAGSRIANAGMVSVSFGTSVCANSVGDRPFQGVSDAIDHFCAVDGKPINMVFLRNGTTFMNTVVKMFASATGLSFGDLMKQVLDAKPDCDGLVALPFMDDEPGLSIHEGGKASLFNINESNAGAANAIRAALTATIMNLNSGMSILDQQGYPRTEIVLTGGLTKTPELGQILADATSTAVSLQSGADEGTAVGAALLAAFRFAVSNGKQDDWSEFVGGFRESAAHHFSPNEETGYEKFESAYRELIAKA